MNRCSGYWCDVIDPRTGAALHSTPGSHYDEVIGASVLLGYDQVTPEGRTLSLISHPEAATQVRCPATAAAHAPRSLWQVGSTAGVWNLLVAVLCCVPSLQLVASGFTGGSCKLLSAQQAL